MHSGTLSNQQFKSFIYVTRTGCKMRECDWYCKHFECTLERKNTCLDGGCGILVGLGSILLARPPGWIDQRHQDDGQHQEVAQEVDRLPRLHGGREVQQLRSANTQPSQDTTCFHVPACWNTSCHRLSARNACLHAHVRKLHLRHACLVGWSSCMQFSGVPSSRSTPGMTFSRPWMHAISLKRRPCYHTIHHAQAHILRHCHACPVQASPFWANSTLQSSA